MLRLLLALSIALTGVSAVATPMHHAVTATKTPKGCPQVPPMATPSKCPEMPPMAMNHGEHDSMPREGSEALPGSALCIGCIAPATVHPPAITVPVETHMLPAPTPALSGLKLRAHPPATPPPRHG